MQLVQSRNLNYSVILHVAAVLLLLVGIPVLLPSTPEPAPMVMSVQVLPISEVSNVKPSDKPIQKEQHAPTPKMKPLPTPPAPPVAKEAPPPPPAEKAPEKTEPTPPKDAEALKKAPPPPKAATKPDDFAALMNNLAKEKAKAEAPPTPAAPTPPKEVAKDKTSAPANETQSNAAYDPSKEMSMSEKDAFRGQFIPCWRAPAGAKDAKSLIVLVKAEVTEDGTVKTATVSSDQLGRYNSDMLFRAAADSAVRAVYKCSPIKFLPKAPYATWSTMTLSFDPQDL